MGRQMKTIIDRAAKLEGVRTSQFIREAAYARAIVVLLQHQDRWGRVAQHLIALGRRTHDPEVIALTQLLMEHARDERDARDDRDDRLVED